MLRRGRPYVYRLYFEIQVRGEDEAMEVDEEGREAEGEEGEEKDGDAKGEDEDLPDDLNLDNNVHEVRVTRSPFDTLPELSPPRFLG